MQYIKERQGNHPRPMLAFCQPDKPSVRNPTVHPFSQIFCFVWFGLVDELIYWLFLGNKNRMINTIVNLIDIKKILFYSDFLFK
jgi:hypothetical protein